MWAFLVLTLALTVRATNTNNDTEVEEQLDIARGSQCGRMRHKENARALSFSYGALGFIVSLCSSVPLAFLRQKKKTLPDSLAWSWSPALPTMPVFYSPVPENLQMGLAYMGGSVFTNNRTADSDFTREQEDTSVVNELVSHLPLQMLLYFNMFYFPCWWFSAVFMLEVKFYYLPGYYQALLITGMILLTVIEVVRLYLGYIGNLREKVPELAAFWLLSFMFQLPVLLFFLTDEGIIILPLERAVHSLYLAFLLAQILASFLALRTMTRKLTLLFHLRQFGKVEGFRHAGMSPVYGLPYHRSVLPMSPTHDMYH
ncbi:hypothetical protein L3Q82_023067 [Scortum barcoo]|uniref:Uncharacterized protein n=1 Tax=Scortum barcoo TaxID=214431 RepID=A0ACB8WXN9_9TELE|nr:hypothetical protein L3Q82_023067 [Scortum barcoo]